MSHSPGSFDRHAAAVAGFLSVVLTALSATLSATAEPASVAATAPSTDRADANLRYPPSSARYGVVIAGAIMTSVTYGGAAAMGAGWSEVPGADMLYIPVAGPWIALGESGCAPTEESAPGAGDCEAIMVARGLLFVLDGLLQAGGLVIVTEGIFMTTESESAAPAEPKKASIAPAPFVTRDAIGVGLLGTF